MLKFMRNGPAIFLAIVTLVECQAKRDPPASRFRVLLPDTTKTHRPNKKFDDLVSLAKKLGLPKLDTGVAGTKIRL